MGSNSGGNCPKIMVFRPTLEEMGNFEAYITSMESVGAHKAGLAKIIPPKEWVPRKNGYDNIKLFIPSPIEQIVHGQQGLYTQYNIQKKAMHVSEFKRLAETSRYKTPPHFDYEDLERKYWKNISFNPPIYGADVSGSLTDSTVNEFNINRLNTILDLVGSNYGIKIEGVNTAYLYFGMWKTTFPWHTEDMDLYSINYLHFGAPKSWYAIPPEHGKRLERLAAGFFPSSQQECSAFLRHKMTLISPQILKQYSIPFNKITQEPGEFMITFPYGYHAGFNHGFNCAESTNFATLRWIEYGKRAFKCTCRKDGVKISMDVFVRTFQPTHYDLWLEGKDMGCHPEDPTRVYAAPPPSKSELSFWKSEGGRMQSISGKMEAISKRLPFATQLEGCKRLKSKTAGNNEEDQDTDDTEIYEPDVLQVTPAKKTTKAKPKKCVPTRTVSRPTRIQKIKVKGDILSDENVKPRTVKKSLSSAKKREKALTAQKAEDLYRPSSSCNASISLPDMESQTSEGRSLSTANSTPNEKPVPKLSSDSLSPVVIPKLKIQKHGTMFHCSTMFNNSPSITNSDSCNTQQTSSMQNKNFVDKLNHQLGQNAIQNRTKQCNIVPVITYIADQKQSVNQIVQPSVQSSELSHANSYPSTKNHDLAANALCESEMPDLTSTNKCLSVNSKVGVLHFQSAGTVSVCDKIPFPHCSSMQSGELVCGDILSFSAPVLQPAVDDDNLVDLQNGSYVIDARNNIAEHHTSNEMSDYRELHQDSLIHSLKVTIPDNLEQELFRKQKYKRSKLERHHKRHKLNPHKSSKSMEANEHSSGKFVKSLGHLWKYQAANLKAEQDFNLMSSASEPHCSICVVFRSFKSKTEGGQSEDLTRSPKGEESVPILPSKSQVLVPTSLFSAVTKEMPELPTSFSSSPPRLLLPQEAALDNNPLLAPDGSAPLFRCKDCRVCVHATCYGILREETEWMCDRCNKNEKDQDCYLCSIRGGALKQTSNGLWVHVVCAILIPESFFTNVITKDIVDLSGITKQRKKLKCNFCWPMVQRLCGRHAGVCVQCTSGKCCSSFHVLCGFMAGVSYEPYYGPYPVRIICQRHSRTKDMSPRELRPLKIGESVIGKQSNKRYYHCEVLQVDKKILYSIEFDTTSYCDNVLEQDILSPLSSLVVGENVDVRWLDGLVYTCTYRGQQEVCNVKVEFDDGSQATVKREELYTKDETLPKRVLSKLSFATDRKKLFDEEIVADDK